DAALIGGGGEAGDVTEHTAAERHDGGVAAMAVVQQVVINAVCRRQVLVAFAIGQDQGVGIVCRQGGPDALEIEGRNNVVGDDQHARSRHGAAVAVRPVQQVVADVNLISAAAEIDRQGSGRLRVHG